MKSQQKKKVSKDRLTITRQTTRSMSLKNRNENSPPIPIDVIITIFSKLCLKSIARCRCVSKLRASILRCSDFTELFLSMSCSSSPKLLFACQKDGDLYFFSSPQPQNPNENSYSFAVSNYRMKFSFNGNCENIGNVNGLICLNDVRVLNGKKKTMVKIFNPSTGHALILPKVKPHRSNVWSLFGYDPIGKQFKVLAMSTKHGRYDVMCDEFQVATLGNEKMSWKKIECCIPHYPPHEKICINGVLYYTFINMYTNTGTIVCFDIRFEKLSFVKTTGILKEALINRTIKLIKYNGKLGLLQYDEKNVRSNFNIGGNLEFKLWVLEDHEKEEWFEYTFRYPNVPRNIGENVISRFIGVTQEKEIVLSSYYHCCPFYLYYLNFERNTFKRVEIQGMEACNNSTCRIFLDHVEDVKLYGKCLGIS